MTSHEPLSTKNDIARAIARPIEQAESPLRQPPAKVFRKRKRMYHKKFRGQLPITYVDTRLYEGGHDDCYEAYSPNDLRWVRRIHYLLDAHGILRWQ